MMGENIGYTNPLLTEEGEGKTDVQDCHWSFVSCP